jgi:hypothetical protein
LPDKGHSRGLNVCRFWLSILPRLDHRRRLLFEFSFIILGVKEVGDRVTDGRSMECAA